MKLSPMMEQYISIKKNYEDCILFFRLGDFYEMFFDDAKLGSKELELTLTGKNCGQEERAPMCGVPFHSAESYIAKLVDKGYKVAICEQVEDRSLCFNMRQGTGILSSICLLRADFAKSDSVSPESPLACILSLPV